MGRTQNTEINSQLSVLIKSVKNQLNNLPQPMPIKLVFTLGAGGVRELCNN